MEREIFLTGIGGQGVQLAGRILALAATREGRYVMSLGTYGGTMRGGNTDSTVVVADEPIASPPIVSRAWSAVVAHPRYWEPLRRKLRPEGVVVFDAELAQDGLPVDEAQAFPVAADSLAREAGAPLARSLVLLAAFSAVTGMVKLASLVAAMEESLPPYRRQHAAANTKALEAGFSALLADAAPAWTVGEAQ